MTVRASCLTSSIVPSQGTLQSGPAAPVGVAAFMSAHSKTPYITPSMDFYSRNGVVWGRRGAQLEFSLLLCPAHMAENTPRIDIKTLNDPHCSL